MKEDFLVQLARINGERAQAWCQGQDPGIGYWGLEFGGEAGELLNKIKKLEREKLGWEGSRTTIGETMHEIGDNLICLDALARSLGVTLAACAAMAFNSKSIEMDFPQRLTP